MRAQCLPGSARLHPRAAQGDGTLPRLHLRHQAVTLTLRRGEPVPQRRLVGFHRLQLRPQLRPPRRRVRARRRTKLRGRGPDLCRQLLQPLLQVGRAPPSGGLGQPAHQQALGLCDRARDPVGECGHVRSHLCRIGLQLGGVLGRPAAHGGKPRGAED